MTLTYSELEDFLAEIHRVAPEKRTALKGRLKHFQRLGWPAGTNKGKGARVEYGIGQTMMLAMGMELLQLGLTPERIVLQFKFSSRLLADSFSEALQEYGPHSDDIFYAFSPETLQSLRGEEDEFWLRAVVSSKSKLHEFFDAEIFRSARRFAFINISEILYEYITYFIDKGLGAPERLREPIENWQRVATEELEKSGLAWTGEVSDGNP